MADIKKKASSKMNSRYRVSYVFIKAPDLKLIASVKTIITCLTGNAAFATLTGLLAELTTALTAFEAAVAAKAQNRNRLPSPPGGMRRVKPCWTRRARPGPPSRAFAMNDLPTLESSGFKARSANPRRRHLLANARHLTGVQPWLRADIAAIDADFLSQSVSNTVED